MSVVKLFNGEEFTGNIIEDRDSVLVLEDFSDFSSSKKIIQKRDIFSIDL